MKTNIALIGFMGTGKTSTGRILAERLGKKLVEVDSIIEKKAGKPISQIFREDGEIAFREMEIEAIKEVASRGDQIIDCGGGVVLNKINIDRLKQNAVIIWLKASPETVARRTAQSSNVRPLLQGRNNIQNIHSMMRLRQPYYEAAADIQIDTSGSDVRSLAEQIIKKLRQNESIS